MDGRMSAGSEKIEHRNAWQWEYENKNGWSRRKNRNALPSVPSLLFI
jgi:hypothetical protein